MGQRLVEPNMNERNSEAFEAVQSRRHHKALEEQNSRLTEALRKAKFRLAIEASTARILSLALTPDSGNRDGELL